MFEAALGRASASGKLFDRPPADLSRLNRMLFQSERVLTAPEGLPRRPWFRHQLYAPGAYTGYGVKTVPYVREALEQKAWDEARRGIEVVRERLTALAAHLDAAARLLQ
jgi:N-acetylated-alpha-linked acidic dipeptidase